MTILLVLIPLGLMLLAVAIGAFTWAVRHGQFDELEDEAGRILFDDETTRIARDSPRSATGDRE